MLRKIDAQWNCSFSNFGWTPTVGESHNFREMRPIYAREWVVILTNYAYMMTTPQYKYVLANFKKVMGGDLYDNEKVPFTAEKYQSEMERFKAKKNFVLGQTSPAYGGPGGGATWGITDWNFYGHYASFSGWESITHEFMHCMDYGHNSNMTYAAKTPGRRERRLDRVHPAAAHVVEQEGRPAIYRPQPAGFPQTGECAVS